MLSDKAALITAITELPDGTLVSILDVEQILADAFGEAMVGNVERVESEHELCVFFADDSMVARERSPKCSTRWVSSIFRPTMDDEAWERLKAMADARAKYWVQICMIRYR